MKKIWQDLLRIRSVGEDDSFFELGGHSLAAARLIARLEKEFDVQLSLSALFNAPTVSQLAALISSGLAPSQPDAVPIQPAGMHPPLHCLAADRCFMTLRICSVRINHCWECLHQMALRCPPYRLEDYAAAQVQSIRQFQTEEPYFVGGWSAAAGAAYEVAQQLRAQGQEVSLLVLFDGINPAASQDLARQECLRDRISRIAARVRFHVSNLASDEVGSIFPYLQDRWKWIKLLSRIRIWSISYRVLQRLRLQIPRWMQDPTDILIHCFYRYRPEPYPGRVLLFRHGSRPKGTPGDPLLG